MKIRITFAAALSLTLPCIAQAPETLAKRIVLLKDRPFDLETLREAIRTRRPDAAIDEIVASLEAKMSKHQQGLVTWLSARQGKVTKQWWLINGLAVEAPRATLDQLAQHEAVAAVYADETRKPGWIRTATNNRNHKVNGLHSQGIKGKGTTIAVLDSGLDSDMAGSNRPHRCFYVDGDPTNTTGGGLSGSRLLANIKMGIQPADDILGHGTMVAAIAGGEVWDNPSAGPGHAPEASLVGYSVADLANGSAQLSTIINAIQTMVADRMQYGTNVANLSYDGTSVPSAPEQQALDQAVLVGDILFAVLAGNSGAVSNAYSHAATNVIAVGAARANIHEVATFTSEGPIQPGRTFPDITANGVNITGPLRDAETSNRTASGTSNASPQVAGAAALYRGIKPSASALETKAALLATTEDISQYNPNSNANVFGQGYLRDDVLATVAQGMGAVHLDPLTAGTPSRSYQFNVTAGKNYSAVVAWYRYDTNLNLGWSNLSLEAREGALVLGRSDSALNPYEKISFRAIRTATVTFVITAKTLEAGVTSLPTALVITEVPPVILSQPGAVTAFGKGCQGSLRIFGSPVTNSISFLGQPTIGTSHQIQVSKTLPLAPIALVLSLSKTQWGSLSLPINLTPAGASGCSIYVSLDLLLMLTASNGLFGSATRTFNVPYDTALIGFKYYLQAAAADGPANLMGLTTTSALEVKMGN